MLKAQQRVRDATPYARELVRALEAVVSRSSSVDHPLVNEAAEPSRAAVLIMTSDRGFAGGFNAGVLREAESLRADPGGPRPDRGAVRHRPQGHQLAPVP